jgi:hypothetical protein
MPPPAAGVAGVVAGGVVSAAGVLVAGVAGVAPAVEASAPRDGETGLTAGLATDALPLAGDDIDAAGLKDASGLEDVCGLEAIAPPEDVPELEDVPPLTETPAGGASLYPASAASIAELDSPG